MTVPRLFRLMCLGMVSMSVVACGGTDNNAPETSASSEAASGPTGATASASATADNPCPLTVEQVTAITGVPMEQPPGGCTFFPANGRDIPHVFFVLHSPMVCSSIQPSELGFTEPVQGLPARSAFIRDQLDGTHLLVCRENARAFDVVVDIKNDRAQNRSAALALVKQVLGGQ